MGNEQSKKWRHWAHHFKVMEYKIFQSLTVF